MRRTTIAIGISAAMIIVGAGHAFAGVLASDSASDVTYADGWDGANGDAPGEGNPPPDNGGFGFEAWDFDGGYWPAPIIPCCYDEPHFIAGVNAASSAFNDLGDPAWGLTNSIVNQEVAGTTALFARRPFSSPLAVGQTISLDVDNPVMQPLGAFDTNGFFVRLVTSNQTERLGFFTTKGFNGDQWTVFDSLGDGAGTGITDVAGSSGFNLAVSLTGPESYELTVNPLGGGPAMVFSGDLANTGGGAIEGIQVSIFGNASSPTGERELFFDNLEISTPIDCDLTGDSACDTTDLRVLYDRIASGDASNADISTWLTQAGTENGKTYKTGDTDLDGSVLGNDFTILASNFGDTGLPGAYWDDGNFNGDAPSGVFGVLGGDFTQLASNFGFTSVSSVPEPDSFAVLLTALIGLMGLMRSRR